MNHLEIQCQRQTNEDGGIYYDMEFCVDGRRFLDMIKEFETPFAEKLAGEYSNRFYGDYTTDFLLGREPDCGEKDDKTELLCCTCGCLGCWPLAVRIRVVENSVIWESFEQPHRNWSYAGFGPFEFDLQQYQAAIAKIPQVMPPSGTLGQ